MAAADESRVKIAAAPEWARRDSYELNAGDPGAFINQGICLLLQDVQVNLVGDLRGVFVRKALRIVTQAGAQRAAQFAVDFDPLFQHVEIHTIRVVRNDDTFEHAGADALEVLRREKDLERYVLSGQLTITCIIPDVRAGDIVEVAWTTFGQNPILAGKFFDWQSFESGVPVLSRRHRLISPATRNIASKTFGKVPVPETDEKDGIIDRRWICNHRPAAEIEPLSPSWQVLAASIQFSEVSQWQDVANLFLPHYEVSKCPSELHDEAVRIGAAEAGPEERVLAVLRTIQQRIRYLSLSLGEGGLAPRELREIWTTGYGDCKDSARLFVALARELGIDAAPALVSTNYGPALSGWLPSATVFNHCIVRVRFDGKTYWVDPTIRSNLNSLAAAANRHAGWALPLTIETAALEKMEGRSVALLFDADEKISFGPATDSPAALLVRYNYYLGNADSVREQIANQGVPTYAKKLLARLQTAWPALTEAKEISIDDDRSENRISISGTYTIPAPWKTLKKAVAATIPNRVMGTNLAVLNPKARTNDIFLGAPRILRRRLEVDLPINWKAEPIDKVLDAPGMRFSRSMKLVNRRKIVDEQELVVNSETAPPSAAGEYAKFADQLRERSGLSLSSGFSGTRFVDRRQRRRTFYYVYLGAVILIFLANALSRMPSN